MNDLERIARRYAEWRPCKMPKHLQDAIQILEDLSAPDILPHTVGKVTSRGVKNAISTKSGSSQWKPRCLWDEPKMP